MVNGNYNIYGDRPASESKYVEDHVQPQTAEHKPKRKYSRTTNELQSSLNMTHQLDNETDSIKYEKTKEPRLLRYVPTTDVEEHFIAEKFETYDMKPDLEERPRRYAFTKKPKNPADGSVNYGYSGSSSSSPNANLPTITEYTEPYNSYRDKSKDETLEGFESRFDRFFARPMDNNVKYDGTHPDSLYRVAAGANAGDSRTVRVVKALRWPTALIAVCAALAVFVYFLMPSKINAHDNVNSTTWDSSAVRYDTSAHPKIKVFTTVTKTYTTETDDLSSESFTDTNDAFNPTSTQQPTSTPKKETTKKPVEIDFYNPDQLSDIISIIDSITGGSGTIQPVLAPVYPDHITPEVQYGDKDKGRIPKLFDNKNQLSEDTTIKPHITQKPEKPLAIFFNSEENPETLNRAETTGATNTNRQKKTSSSEEAERLFPLEELLALEPEIRDTSQEFVGAVQKFTSGHSKVFGVGIEDLDIMKSTTQSSVYNTRVSPTLPTWYTRDATTKNYPVNSTEDTHCRSPRLKMCRGFLPYDLAGPPIKIKGVSAEHVLSSSLLNHNCSSRLRQFICAILEPECQPLPLPPKKPCPSFCKSLPNCYPEFPLIMQPYVNCDEYELKDCFAPTAPCYADELPCGDGTCVSRHSMCDGVPDCANGRDEEQCTTCPVTKYRCPSSGECIKNLWLCDGILDCPEGEDEVPYVCAKSRHPLIEVPEPPPPGKFPTKDGKDEVETIEEAQAAESAPASAVTRYGVVSGRRDQRADDSSKELLETSDSTNALRRNFTGRSFNTTPRGTIITRTLPPIPLDDYSRERTSSPEPKRRKQSRKKIQNRNSRPTEPSGPFDSSEGGEEMGRSVHEPPRPRVNKVFSTDSNKTSNAYERYINNRAVVEALQKELEEDRKMRMKSIPDEMVVEKEDSVTEGKPLGGLSSPCPVGELRCVDGRCITLAMLCDGNIDCSDHADEDNCFT